MVLWYCKQFSWDEYVLTSHMSTAQVSFTPRTLALRYHGCPTRSRRGCMFQGKLYIGFNKTSLQTQLLCSMVYMHGWISLCYLLCNTCKWNFSPSLPSAPRAGKILAEISTWQWRASETLAELTEFPASWKISRQDLGLVSASRKFFGDILGQIGHTFQTGLVSVVEGSKS